MKHQMWEQGVNPLVIPNGVPSMLLRSRNGRLRPRCTEAYRSRCAHQGRPLGPGQAVLMAVDALYELKSEGLDAVLVARGGVEEHGAEVRARARLCGLRMVEVALTEPSLDALIQGFHEAGPADILDVRSPIPLDLLGMLYHSSDAVLANSGREPFGLVGLETMASGGVAFTGSTGEDYAVHLQNAVVLDEDDPRELAWQIRYLREHPAASRRLRTGGRRTARGYLWRWC